MSLWGEEISLLEEPGSNIDLDDLQITLDVLCLTLHPEMEELVEWNNTVRTVSYCSTPPMPESEPLKSIDEDEDDLSASRSDIQTEIACHQLSHLPSFEQETMKMCIQRVGIFTSNVLKQMTLPCYHLGKLGEY
ncbi:uncharacterized protein LOC143249008 isoform X13 [Tachypleus tridentatus]|uniref:uncharacterized protein LOC143249008 isoform X13 n=1 Tax=Tachypleus tridentatus TaxID=6853 RepID=UPI003FD012AB